MARNSTPLQQSAGMANWEKLVLKGACKNLRNLMGRHGVKHFYIDMTVMENYLIDVIDSDYLKRKQELKEQNDVQHKSGAGLL